MQITETKSEGLSREFKIALPAKDIEEKISHRLKELATTAQLPGFRPGKVPVSVLRKKYGPSVMGEILERAVNDSSQQALAEKGLRPAMQPQIEVTSFEDGGDLEYTLAVELLPEIKPVDFSKIKLQRMIAKEDKKAVDEALANLAKSHGSSAPVKEKRKTMSGDILTIDFVGRIDGKEFAGGKAEGYELTLGSNAFIPGFEDQLIGVNAGDEVTVNVSFPENYGAEELSGKAVVFDVTVHEINEQVESAIDDELAKKLGLENLDALKKSITEERAKEFDQLARMHLKRTLLDELAEAHDFEVPEKLLEQEFEQIWAQYEEQKKSGNPDIDDEEGKSEEEQKVEFRDIAERRIRLGLLLSEVGRSNNLQIEQEDLNKQLMAEARRYPGREQEVLEHYKKNPQAMEQLSAPIFEEKVVDFILEQATITDKAVSTDELMKAMQEEPAKPQSKAKAKAKATPKPKTKKPAKKDK